MKVLIVRGSCYLRVFIGVVNPHIGSRGLEFIGFVQGL